MIRTLLFLRILQPWYGIIKLLQSESKSHITPSFKKFISFGWTIRLSVQMVRLESLLAGARHTSNEVISGIGKAAGEVGSRLSVNPQRKKKGEIDGNELEIHRLKVENEWLRKRVHDLEAEFQLKQQVKTSSSLPLKHSHNMAIDTDLSLTKFAFLRASNISIGKKLGCGAFGAVYRGTIHNCITCALKFMSQSIAAELKNEVSIMDQIDHPNIVSLYGVVLDDGQPVPEQWPQGLRPPCLVMEYMGYSYDKKHTTSTFIDYLLATKELRDQQEHWIRICGMLQGAARGMAYLHSHGVMHRDLKGVNLLLDSRGNLKIADLGLATLYANKKLETIAITGSWLDGPLKPPPTDAKAMGLTTGAGTYTHMAPEVMLSANYDTSADVFSFGIIISEAVAASEAEAIVDLTRTPKFGIDTTKLAEMAGSGKIANQLVALAGQCCELDPKERPDANQIVGRLQLILLEYQSSRLNKVAVKESSYKTGLSVAMESEASNKVFSMADKNGDGYLCFEEMKWLTKVSDDSDLSQEEYETICDAVSAESANGLTAQHVLKLYRELRAGDAVEDCQILSSSLSNEKTLVDHQYLKT
jgi:serine/threonine protein kinase